MHHVNWAQYAQNKLEITRVWKGGKKYLNVPPVFTNIAELEIYLFKKKSPLYLIILLIIT